MRHPPEDPPSDGDHPHDNGDHQHDVVHHIAPKLAKTSSDVVATSLMREELLGLYSLFPHLVVLDTAQALDDGYPEEEKEADAGSPENQHPRHVWLGWTVGVRVTGGHCLDHYKDHFLNQNMSDIYYK